MGEDSMQPDQTFAQGEAYERAGNTNAARAMFAQAAKAGNTDALTALARNLLVQQPFDIANGIAMMKAAADRGSVEATQLCAVLAAQDEALPEHWNAALDYLVRAARLGSAGAQRQLALLADPG